MTVVVYIAFLLLVSRDGENLSKAQVFTCFSTPFFNMFIIIRNGKIVWKHGSYCWYFPLNLKYLGWPYRAYIKTAKNSDFREELLSENDFENIFCHVLLLWLWCHGFWGSSEHRYRSKRVLQMLLVCYYLLNSQSIPINNKLWKKAGS